MYMEDTIRSSGSQTSPGLRTARRCAGAEPAISGVNQVVALDAAGRGGGKESSPAPERPNKWPGHREASEEWLPELRTREQSHLADLGKKLSSQAPQEWPEELQVGQDRAKPGSELGVLPSSVSPAPEWLQQQGSGQETEDLQWRQQNPRTVKGQAPKRWQPTPGHQAASGSDIVQATEPSCTLDSCGQYLEDKLLTEAGPPHIGPQGTLPEPGPGGDKDRSQQAKPLMPTATPEKTGNSFLPSMPGLNTPKPGAKPAPGPATPPKAGDTGERRELGYAPKQPPEPTATAGAQNLGSTGQGFMKCLLEVEEEEAMQRRATKARALPNRKAPKTLNPVPASAPVGNSATNLPPTLPQTPSSAPATAPSWVLPPAPGGAPVPASVPITVLPAPALDLGWRKTMFLHHSGDRSLSHAKARQELEERCFLNLYQNWEARSEEHLTLKQEEAFHSYFEIFNGPDEVDAHSLQNVLLIVGISLTPVQVEDALMSADIDGDGHVGFKDFLAVMTDTKRFFCSVEQNVLTATPNPHTLLFEILSLLVEMLALPEATLEEITNYYQKKLKEGTCKAREMESAIGRLRSRKKLPYNLQQAETLEVPERRVLRILSRLKHQSYAANLQSPYAQVPCIPLCPRLDKKMAGRNQCTPTNPSPDIHSLYLQSGSQVSREHSSESRKWLSSVPARTH